VVIEGIVMKRKLHSSVIPLKDVPLDNAQPDKPRHLDVLVVDDEQIIANTLGIILSSNGYLTKVTYDGISALEIAREHHPRLVITDVVMPGITGVELALALETIAPETKILLFSGQAASLDLLAEARKKGRDFAILTKPVHPTDMIRRVSEYIVPESESEERFAMTE
jgi:DNA-binding NtrC family response regulator